MFAKIMGVVKKHKIISAIVVVVAVIASYFWYKSASAGTTQITYVLDTVKRGTLTSYVAGSGQISSSEQVDIKPKASGDITIIKVAEGQEVKSGDVLAMINPKDALKTVRDAQTSLESAQLSMDKTTQPASSDSIFQSENSLNDTKISLQKLKLTQQINYQNAQDAKTKAEDTLNKSYADAYNAIADTYIDLPGVMSSMYNMISGTEISATEPLVDRGATNDSVLVNSILFNDVNARTQMSELVNLSKTAYSQAKNLYDPGFDEYKSTSRSADKQSIEDLLTKTIAVTNKVSDAINAINNALGYQSKYRSEHGLAAFSKVSSYLTSLGSYTSQVNGHSSSISNLRQTITDSQNSLTNAKRSLQQMDQNNPLDIASAEASIKQKEASLAALKAGADPLDVRSQQLVVQQRLNSLRDAQEQLADYTIRAPFDGVVAKLSILKGDTVSSGTAVITMTTKQQVAQISLNEVDLAKVKLGQKATFTFDAIPDLEITGQVINIDSIGTVSQGVVTYNVKIALDAQDDRIKTGMSVSTNIITDVRQNVLYVASSAVKPSGNSNIVLVPNENVSADAISSSTGNGIVLKNTPINKPVRLGLVNDTSSEITGGLNEGDTIIVRTVTKTATAAQTSGTSLFQVPGNNRARTTTGAAGGRGFGG